MEASWQNLLLSEYAIDDGSPCTYGAIKVLVTAAACMIGANGQVQKQAFNRACSSVCTYTLSGSVGRPAVCHVSIIVTQ